MTAARTILDNRRARGMSKKERPETTERRCPYCQSESIEPTGSVTADKALIKALYRSASRDGDFILVREVRF
jgi:hypothetical protein